MRGRSRKTITYKIEDKQDGAVDNSGRGVACHICLRNNTLRPLRRLLERSSFEEKVWMYLGPGPLRPNSDHLWCCFSFTSHRSFLRLIKAPRSRFCQRVEMDLPSHPSDMEVIRRHGHGMVTLRALGHHNYWHIHLPIHPSHTTRLFMRQTIQYLSLMLIGDQISGVVFLLRHFHSIR